MPVALLTNYLAPYRVPLYERLAQRFELEVLCYGGGERYVPAWFANLDEQLAHAPFPAQRLERITEALALGRRYEALVAPFAGGAMLPAAYLGAKARKRRFVLWASVWAQPRSAAHMIARPVTRHIYRHADAVVAYGEHVRRFVTGVRGRDDDVYVAPQSVEPELFRREVGTPEVVHFRHHHDLPPGPLVLYVGRLVPEKGIEVLVRALSEIEATLVVIGDGPLAELVEATPRTRLLGPRPRAELPVAYAAADCMVLPSLPTPRFLEPWGLVCNEAMHVGCPVVASDAVGAVAGGLVRDGETGVVVPAGDAKALAQALRRLLHAQGGRALLATAAKQAVASYTYEAMAAAFEQALGRY